MTAQQCFTEGCDKHGIYKSPYGDYYCYNCWVKVRVYYKHDIINKNKPKSPESGIGESTYDKRN